MLKISKKLIIQKLSELTIKKEKMKIEKCKMHSKEKNIYCAECKIEMCRECFLSHKNLPIFESHHQGDVNLKNNLFNNKCSLHNYLKICYSCNDCNTELCEVCKFNHDTEHQIGFLIDFKDDKKEVLKSEINSPSALEEVRRSLNDSKRELKGEINREVSNLKEKIQSIIDHLEEILIKLDNEKETLFEEQTLTILSLMVCWIFFFQM